MPEITDIVIDFQTQHVMQFAEMAQQVEVIKPEEFVLDRESIRKKAEEARRRAEEERRREMVASRKLNSELSGM